RRRATPTSAPRAWRLLSSAVVPACPPTAGCHGGATPPTHGPLGGSRLPPGGRRVRGGRPLMGKRTRRSDGRFDHLRRRRHGVGEGSCARGPRSGRGGGRRRVF